MRHNAAIFIKNEEGEILPAQVRDPSMEPLEPEKRLMLAVLECALNDFQTYAIVRTGRGRGIFKEVDAWFRSSATGPFNFEGICQATGLDPDYIREGLSKWHDSTGCCNTHQVLDSRRTVRTGQGADPKTRSAVLPRKSRFTPERPCVPIEMRSARMDWACSTILSGG